MTARDDSGEQFPEELRRALDGVADAGGDDVPPQHAFERLVTEVRADQRERLRRELRWFAACALALVTLVLLAIANSPRLFVLAQGVLGSGVVAGAAAHALRRRAT